MEKLEGCVIKAMKLSMEAHANQKDKAGENYFLHPVTVAMTLAKNGYSDEYIATALLHDVVEDTPYTLEQLSEMGFSKNIITALSLLTHKEDVPYMNYVKAAKNNPIA
jgi:(p)ppGpp synthase/HD superfamily hydrolase